MTHNKITPLLNRVAVFMALGLAVVSGACNKDDADVEATDYVSTESVAVTSFSLSADLRIMRNLDSVFFSIDLEHGVIFNADSLPKGTKITKLVPKISYPSTVTSAVIEMKNGTHREGTVNYYANASDTIDFTGDVFLTLGASNNSITKTYRLKVNVHEEDPDTIYWDRVGDMALPSRLPEPKAQKSLAMQSGVKSLIQEKDGSYTMAETSDIFAGAWSKQEVSLDFDPVLESFTAHSDGNLYLAGKGSLWQSADGLSWTSVASGWSQIIGSYGAELLGADGSKMISYPAGTFGGITLPQEFPVGGYSNPISFDIRWSSEPTLVLFGGVTANGAISDASWAFDGSQWVNIADNALPALTGLSVVNYYSYLKSSSNSLLKEFEACLAFGGRDAAGNDNNTVYVSYDHGINWQRAQNYMQLPANVKAGYMVNALSIGTSMNSNLSDRWKAKRRLPFEIDGDVIKWDCPYLFLLGGYDTQGTLNDRIRCGVLQRLTFVPLF